MWSTFSCRPRVCFVETMSFSRALSPRPSMVSWSKDSCVLTGLAWCARSWVSWVLQRVFDEYTSECGVVFRAVSLRLPTAVYYRNVLRTCLRLPVLFESNSSESSLRYGCRGDFCYSVGRNVRTHHLCIRLYTFTSGEKKVPADTCTLWKWAASGIWLISTD